MPARRSGLPAAFKTSRRAIAYRPDAGDATVQSRLIDEHARRHGWLVVERFADEMPAGTDAPRSHPQLLAALHALGPGDVLLVARRDGAAGDAALQRAVIDVLVERRGAHAVWCNEAEPPASADTLRALVRLVGRFEQHASRARARAAIAARKARGQRVGALPYGQTADERMVLAVVRRSRQAGASYKATADELNRRRLTTRRGTSWRPQYVASLLRTQQSIDAGARSALRRSGPEAPGKSPR